MLGLAVSFVGFLGAVLYHAAALRKNNLRHPTGQHS